MPHLEEAARPSVVSDSKGLFPVIVVDDDPDDLFFITRRMRKSGVRNPIMTFGDGEDAISYFNQIREQGTFAAPACAVFCDIKMPRTSGFELLRSFKQWPEFAQIRFFMLSGSNETADRERAAALGANRYLVKFPAEELFAEIIAEADSAFRQANG